MAFVILHMESAKRWAGEHVEFFMHLKAYARERLPAFAVPEWITVVEELPVRHRYDAHPVQRVFKNEIAHPPENVHWEDSKDGLAKMGCFRKAVVTRLLLLRSI